MQTTYLQAHPAGSQYRDGKGGTQVLRPSVRHIQWIYRCMRNEGLNPSSARMGLVHALHAGQRDMRARVENAVRDL